MEDIDVRKPIDIEKMTPHEFERHKQRIRDMEASLSMTSQKQIDRMTIQSNAESYITQGGHLRDVSAFCRNFQNYVPQEALQPMMESGRKGYDYVRKNWLMSMTKVRDGVGPAEAFYSSVAPGMSDKEHAAYKRILKDNKPKQHQDFSKKRKFNRGGRGGGRGRGGYNAGGGHDYGFDPFRESSGEELETLVIRNEALAKEAWLMKQENERVSLMINNLKVQNYLVNKKLEMLRSDVVLLLLQIKQAHSGVIPYQPVNSDWLSSAGRDHYNDGGRGGRDNHYNSGGGGYRGGYKGSNHRGGQGGGGGGGNTYGSSQAGGGASN